MISNHERVYQATKDRIETLRQRKEQIKTDLSSLNEELINSDMEIRILRQQLPNLELMINEDRKLAKKQRNLEQFKIDIAAANSLEEIDSICWRFISN